MHRLRLNLFSFFAQDFFEALRRWRLLLKTERHQVFADVRNDRHAVAVKDGHALGTILQLWYLLACPDDTLVGFVRQVETAAHELDQDLLRGRELFQPAQVLGESGLHRRRVLSRDTPQADDRSATLATPVHLVAERHETVSLSRTVAFVCSLRCASKVSVL